MFDLPNDAILYADSARGVYIPQYFAESVVRESVSGVSDEDWTILESGPDHEWHWETWESVLNNARVTRASDGQVFVLYQDGDLWLVPVEWSPEDDAWIDATV